jgi:GNAT superfamily N-acetyltransferase
MPEGSPTSSPLPAAASGVIPGYPMDLERQASLADGRSVFIRPIRPGDAAALRNALATADHETLYARFLGSPPHKAAAIQKLVEVDYVNRLALVAVTPEGTGAGIARYEGKPGSDTAEVAVAVDARWRRVGLGSLLLRSLGEAAVPRGIRRFTALVLADNAPVMAVLRASGLPFTIQVERTTAEIVMPLDG